MTATSTPETALGCLSNGDSLFVDGLYDAAIENYTAAICLTDSRSGKGSGEKNSMTAATTSTNDDGNNKVLRFRSFAHRSEAYLSNLKHSHAYNDARAAIALTEERSSLSSTSSSTAKTCDYRDPLLPLRLRPGELALAYDRLARASVGLSNSNMGVAARGKNGRVAFVKLMSKHQATSMMMGGGGDTHVDYDNNKSNEMKEEARVHWERALELVSSSSNGDEAAALLVGKYRKKLAQLDAGDFDNDDDGNPGGMKKGKQDAGGGSGGGSGNDEMNFLAKMSGLMSTSNHASSQQPPLRTQETPSSSSSSPAAAPSSTSSSSSSRGPPKLSNHPATKKETSPVDRGLMSGMPKYQYYQDDNFMKVQILEPNVSPII